VWNARKLPNDGSLNSNPCVREAQQCEGIRILEVPGRIPAIVSGWTCRQNHTPQNYLVLLLVISQVIVLRDSGQKVRATHWRGVHWHEKVPSAGEVGESKKYQFWLREERRHSETFMCMVNMYEITFLHAKRAQAYIFYIFLYF